MMEPFEGWWPVLTSIHTWERFILHVASGAFVWLCTAFGMIQIGRIRERLPRGWWFYITPMFGALWVIALREPWDVANGNPWQKSIIDAVSWMIGIGAGVWMIYRLTPYSMHARARILIFRHQRKIDHKPS